MSLRIIQLIHYNASAKQKSTPSEIQGRWAERDITSNVLWHLCKYDPCTLPDPLNKLMLTGIQLNTVARSLSSVFICTNMYF